MTASTCFASAGNCLSLISTFLNFQSTTGKFFETARPNTLLTPRMSYENSVYYTCDFPVWDDIFYDNNIEKMVSSLESSRKEVEQTFKVAEDYYNLRNRLGLFSENANLISMYYYTRIYIYHNLVKDLKKYTLPRYEKALQIIKDREL